MGIFDLLFGKPAPPMPTLPVVTEAPPDDTLVVEAALELERRLYDASSRALEQTFAKETLVVTFLTTGALVAITAGMQATSPLLVKLPPGERGIIWYFEAAGFLVIVAAVISIGMLKGKEVRDLDDSPKFLAKEPLPQTRLEVADALRSEFSSARTRHEKVLQSRHWWLVGVYLSLILAIGTAFAGTFLAIEGAPQEVQLPSPAKVTPGSRGSYNHSMPRPNPTPRPMPAPSGNGTPIIKGGGGLGGGTNR